MNTISDGLPWQKAPVPDNFLLLDLLYVCLSKCYNHLKEGYLTLRVEVVGCLSSP
ncbi:hypothetical protein ES705_43286 [subsurface metagenome]